MSKDPIDSHPVDTARDAAGEPPERIAPSTRPDLSNGTLLALALDATDDGIWVWHIPSGAAYFNARYCSMLGYEPDALTPSYQTWVDLLHPEDAARTQALIQRHIDDRSNGYEIEFRLRTQPGDWLWILGRGRVVQWDADGKPELMVGSHVNIDSRKQAERRLAEYRERLEKQVQERTVALEQTTALLEATFNAIPDILGVQDDQHRILRYNAAGYRFLNKTHEEVAGRRCYELIGRRDECRACATSRCYRTKRPESLVRYEDALETWLDVRAYPILDEQGNLVRVIEHLRDITAEKKAEAENRRLQEQLQQARKMESLGTLAGGIAHDFNNLLMGIQGRISIMAMDMEPEHPFQTHLQAVETCITNAADLTKQLLGFARSGKYEVQPIDINQLVQDSAARFGRTQKELRISVSPASTHVIVDADRHQIENVLFNMYVNARQAMPDGGTLNLAIDTVDPDESVCRAHRIGPGRYARVSIADTGIGMDEETRRQVFDPFFTTKEKSRGTGLGLASAYGVIQNHGGFITVSSRAGKGTTFTVHLPMSSRSVQADPVKDDRPIRGSGTVLLVDDEAMIIEVGRAMLRRLGYRVIAVRDGRSAVDAVREKGGAIDLVILDMIMPGLDGGKTYDAIRRISPGLPVLLSSGYAIDGQAATIMRKGCNGFIQKPFSVARLSQKIRQILDAAAADHRSDS